MAPTARPGTHRCHRELASPPPPPASMASGERTERMHVLFRNHPENGQSQEQGPGGTPENLASSVAPAWNWLLRTTELPARYAGHMLRRAVRGLSDLASR